MNISISKQNAERALKYYSYYQYIRLGMNAFPIISFLYSNIPSANKNANLKTHEIMTRLKFIGMIKPGEKINTQSMCSYPNCKMTSISRWWNSEDRYTTLGFITSTITRTFELINLALVSDKSGCKILIEDLICCPIGILNLQKTYMDDYNDRIFWCECQTLIQMIEMKINILRDKNPELFPIKDFTNEFKN